MIVEQIGTSNEDSEDPALEARMREKLFASAKPKLADVREARMIAKVFGSTVVADDFLRREKSKPLPGRPPRRFKVYKPTVKYQHWERRADSINAGGWWSVDRYENGKKVGSRTGTDFKERDSLLRRIQVSGVEVTALVVAEVVPRPVGGRLRDSAKPKSQRLAILQQIGQLDSDDIADFSLDDWVWEGDDH